METQEGTKGRRKKEEGWGWWHHKIWGKDVCTPYLSYLALLPRAQRYINTYGGSLSDRYLRLTEVFAGDREGQEISKGKCNAPKVTSVYSVPVVGWTRPMQTSGQREARKWEDSANHVSLPQSRCWRYKRS